MRTGITGNKQSGRRPIYGDFTSVDYMHMQNSIADIDQQFASLPARLRARFDNDPYQVVRFVEKPENQAEAIKLGLLPAPVEPTPSVDPVPDTAVKADPEANPSFQKPTA